MYLFIFLLSLAYVGYHIYHVVKGTAPQWIEKRLYKLRNDRSFEDIDNKRWDTPVGLLSRTLSLTVLFTSFIILTYIIGWKNMSENDFLYAVVFLGAVIITYFVHRNFSGRAHFYRKIALEERGN